MSSLLKISEYIKEITGLHFPAERLSDLERGLVNAQKDFGFEDTPKFIEWLLETRLNENQVKSLALYLTIGETYFFRDVRSLEILRDNILPDLLKEVRLGKKPLRIWCAGCSTGEEPYSLAMWFHEFIPDYNLLDIKIIASDINLNSLEKAQNGIYSDWSFRGTPSWVKFKYFKTKDKLHYISDKIKKKVQFSYINLSDTNYPSIINNIHSFDIILCRNVLMYFDEQTFNAVIKRFHKSLLTDSWFFVSAVEVARNSEINKIFLPVSFPGLTVYKRKNEDTNYEIESINVIEPTEYPDEYIDMSQFKTEYIPPVEEKADNQELIEHVKEFQELSDKETIKAEANLYANQGLYDKAFDLCLKGIDIDKTDPDFHYILFNIYNEKKDIINSFESLKKVLYLEPDHILANYNMANFYDNNNDYNKSLKYLNICLSILNKFDDSELIPFSDDLNVKQMKYIINTQINKFK